MRVAFSLAVGGEVEHLRLSHVGKRRGTSLQFGSIEFANAGWDEGFSHPGDFHGHDLAEGRASFKVVMQRRRARQDRGSADDYIST